MFQAPALERAPAAARSRALASAGPERLVVSRQRIAESRRLKIRGTYAEACRERDRLKEQFPMPTCPFCR
jgi:hypothetical protein